MKKICLILIPTLFLFGCSFTPEYSVPTSAISLNEDIPDSFYHEEDLWKNATPADDTIKGPWWELFNDAELNDLMLLCRKQNPNLKAAFYRVEQARERARMTGSELYPNAGASASYARTGTSKNDYGYRGTFDSWRIGLGLTWDLDFFGRVRSLLDSDTAQAQAILAAYENTMLLLEGELANTYFTLKQANSEVELLKDTVEVRAKQLKLVQDRFDSGFSMILDVKRAEQQVFEAKAQLASATFTVEVMGEYIALLTGSIRAKFTPTKNLLGDHFPSVPKFLPSQMLERRPDIASAERSVYAANSRIGAANAAFFPTVTISASADLASSDIDTLFNASSLAWGVSPKIYNPIFQAGKLIAQRAAALQEHKEFVEKYRATVLNAIFEVESSMTKVHNLKKEYLAREKTMISAREILDLTMKQYEQGYVDFFEVSDAQRVSLLNDREFIRLKGEQYKAIISLIIASGGSWEERRDAVEKMHQESEDNNEDSIFDIITDASVDYNI